LSRLNSPFRVEIRVSEMTPPLRGALLGPCEAAAWSAGEAAWVHDARAKPAAAAATADHDLKRWYQTTGIPIRFLSLTTSVAPPFAARYGQAHAAHEACHRPKIVRFTSSETT
jgi:hypothetical protein